MDVEITVKNYRCFADQKPATFALRSNGFTGFVGVNNSGKSSLLKMFFELRDVFRNLSNPKHVIQMVRAQNTQAFSINKPISDLKEIFHNGNDRDITLEIKINLPGNVNVEQVRELRITIPRNQNTYKIEFPSIQREELLDNAIYSDWFINVRPEESNQTPSKYSLEHLCDAMLVLSQAMYIEAFRNAINVGTNESYFDIQIGESFIKQWKGYKTGGDTDQNAAAIQLQADIKTLFAFDSLEINPTADDKSLHLIINDKAFKLAEVGGGIAQFIVVLANVAVNKPSFVLIDEPELNLHPTLQMDFLSTMASLAREGGVAFSTHSYGLARAMADCIYSVRMNDGVSEVRDFERTAKLSEFLRGLTFSGYRELGFDGVLLVEGRTDVKVFQQFLRMHRKDHQFVLIPLGGSSGITEHSEDELQEIKRISPNVTAVIDSERKSAGEPIAECRQKFKSMCDSIGIPCTILKRRATENYLAECAIKRIKGEKYKGLNEFESSKEVTLGWGKHENWRIAREMRPEDLEDTDLGKFLTDL